MYGDPGVCPKCCFIYTIWLVHNSTVSIKLICCLFILKKLRLIKYEIFAGLEVVGCGSYRRGKQTCGDLDVLVTHEDGDALDDLFEKILAKLKNTGFLTDDLTVLRDGNQQVALFNISAP